VTSLLPIFIFVLHSTLDKGFSFMYFNYFGEFKMKNSQLLLPLFASVLFAACSSTTDDKVAEHNQSMLEIQQQKTNIEQVKREQESAELPDWVLNVPAPDSTGYYAIGYGESKTIFKAIKKANLQAEFGLAKTIKQEISGSERSYEKDNGVGTEQEVYNAVIDKIVDSVQVVGFTQVDQKLISIQGKHTVYTLLKMPYEQYNKILVAQRATTLNKESKNAFFELEERIKKRQQQRTEENNIKHQQKLDVLNVENETLKITAENNKSLNRD